MKTANILAMATLSLGAMMFFSCSDDEPQTKKDLAVRFTGVIGHPIVERDMSQTRATETTWGDADKIGIFMIKDEDASVLASNKQYERMDDSFIAAVGNELYYPLYGDEVKFIAYYPYLAGVTLDEPINFTLAAQTNEAQPTFDMLYATTADSYTKESAGSVPLAFNHKMSKIVLNCMFDPSVELVEITTFSITIRGMKAKGVFNLKTGKVTSTEGSEAEMHPRSISPSSSDFDESYDAIIIPGAYPENKITVEFKINNDYFTWIMGEVEFKENEQYIYNVRLTHTAVIVDATITPWGTTTEIQDVWVN